MLSGSFVKLAGLWVVGQLEITNLYPVYSPKAFPCKKGAETKSLRMP
jgi:hypothetical protein